MNRYTNTATIFAIYHSLNILEIISTSFLSCDFIQQQPFRGKCDDCAAPAGAVQFSGNTISHLLGIASLNSILVAGQSFKELSEHEVSVMLA